MLFVIDMQNDYVDPEKGAMVVEGAKEIVPNILQEIRRQEEQGEPIYYTLDKHQSDEGRSAQEDQWGHELYPPLQQALQKHQAIKKDFHSISPEVAAKLRDEYQDDPNRVITVVGAETNVCVLSNAVMLHNSFPLASVRILKEACAGSTEALHQKALDVMKSLKMEIK
ncbi:cysteine hydrolase family protein [Pisciglobus halotolerans]|uniref:Nicotinamidase-related amidase n=1 Tax=Pisciglobus halotolerans TaxID=745365 RepID=A0A1I3BUZ0_9LACT|nr:isochorismatase family cysteine hydrolase [Pisciglobus halotolerans]SFH65789.1 Nicotinamidase-related amidase [Pisciglobus halotolerans]